MRAFLAILVGFLVWSVIWVGGHQGAVAALPGHYDADGVPTASFLYAGYLVFSVLCSLLAGTIARRIAPARGGAVLGLGLLLLLVGIAFQASVWSREPLWYHLAFLALLVPATLVGGRRAAAA